jgi:hypothetical protein
MLEARTCIKLPRRERNCRHVLRIGSVGKLKIYNMLRHLYIRLNNVSMCIKTDM